MLKPTFNVHGITNITVRKRLGTHANWTIITAYSEDGDAEAILFAAEECPEIEFLPDLDMR